MCPETPGMPTAPPGPAQPAAPGLTIAHPRYHRTVVITLPMPSHDLTLNRVTRRHPGHIARIKRQHRNDARLAALVATPAEWRPAFGEAPVRLDVEIRRRARGQRWDDSAMVEALKPYMDGIEDSGAVFLNDQQVRWGDISWDDRPTGEGVVILTFSGAA